MTTLATLLAKKRKLIERRAQDPGPNELAEIERNLAEIDDGLSRLEEAGASTGRPSANRRV